MKISARILTLVLLFLLLSLQGCGGEKYPSVPEPEDPDNLKDYFPTSKPNTELILKTGHKYRVLTFALSPDEKILVSSDVEGKVKLWDTASGLMLKELESFSDAVYSSSYSNDGKYFAAASFRGNVKIWRMPECRLVYETKDLANAIVFSGDSKYLAASHYGDSIKILNTSDFKVIKDFGIKMDDISCLDFSPDSSLISSGHGSGDVNLWSVKTGKIIKKLEGLYFWVHSVRFSPDGKKLVGASYVLKLGGEWKELYSTAYGKEAFDEDEDDNQQALPGDITKISDKFSNVGKSKDKKIDNPDTDIVIWDVISGRQILSYPHPEAAFCADFSKNGKYFASSGMNNQIVVKDALNGRTIASYSVDGAKYINCVVFSADNRHLYFSGGNGIIMVYDFLKKQLVRQFSRCESLVQTVDVNPDGSMLASGGEDNIIRLWDLKKLEMTDTLANHRKAIQEVRFDATGSFLLSASSDSSVSLWKKTGDSRFVFDKSFEGVHPFLSADVNKDLSVLAAGDVMGYVTFWDFRNGRQLRRVKTHRESVLCVRFTGDGSKLLVASHNEYDDTIKLIETSTGRELQKYSGEGHPAWVLRLIPGTDFFWFAGGNSIKKADITSGKIVERHKADRGPIWTFDTSSDGNILVSGGFRGEINVWKTKDFTKTISFAAGQGEIESISCASDGKFVSAGSESLIKIWSGKTDTPDYTLVGFSDRQWIIYREDGKTKASAGVGKYIDGALINGVLYKSAEYLSRFRVENF